MPLLLLVLVLVLVLVLKVLDGVVEMDEDEAMQRLCKDDLMIDEIDTLGLQRLITVWASRTAA